MSTETAVGEDVEVVGAEGQALSHGHGGGGERLQVLLQRLQVLDQLTIDALHLDKEVVGAFVHLFHASVDLKRRNECLRADRRRERERERKRARRRERVQERRREREKKLGRRDLGNSLLPGP